MAPSDLNMLLEMGFDKDRVEIAVKETRSLQDAIDWLEKNQEKSLDEIKVDTGRDEEEAGPSIEVKAGEAQAKSLVCNDCGKKFRNAGEAEFHAQKSEHTNFSESVDEIAPLTAEEKAAKLEALRQKLAAKRAIQVDEDKLARKKNEEIRRKATKESHDIKEDLQRKEQLKQAAARRREKLEDVEAKKRALAMIEADKEARKRKAEQERIARLPGGGTEAASASQPEAAPASVPGVKRVYTEARLKLQTTNGSVVKTFAAETTLAEVAAAVAEEGMGEVSEFVQNYPKKVFSDVDFGLTVKEAGFVPSAMLIVR
ncbi:putative UBX domain protein [Eremomyces bilateralis CBS 781.70]|uniref:UBX domain protein n=1 Tax=Eremomyces bilateralis CBS 781.70 TaxID=1392243 RepID=A0A6G1FZ86_9PEZI|nr:putative UBX domain protein [Eremomyces bilateralis CBS 781.70]KAF1811104.1 putative UBX domain protein [Eremomyces bilateralis CBS 781.70]